MRTVIKIIISAFALIISSYLLPGVSVDSFLVALIVAVVLSLIDSIVKPVLVAFTIPITVFSFGLFLLVINAGMIMLASHIVKGFDVDGFWWALAFSIILSFIRSLLESIDKKDKHSESQ